MADLVREQITLGVGVTQTVYNTRPANQDYLAHSGAAAGEDLDSGDAVFQHTDGMYYKASASGVANANASGATAATTEDAVGVTAKPARAGEAVTMVYMGHIAGFSGLTPGTKVYLSNTAGAMANAAGTASVVMGRAITSSIVRIVPR